MTGAMEWVVQAFAAGLWTLNHSVPRAFLRLVPRASEALSLGNFYVNAQALGLLWVFCVTLMAAMAMTPLASFSAGTGDGIPVAAAEVTQRPLQVLALLYVYYCMCRIIVLLSGTMWTVMWETHHDFPTMRQMLLGRRRRARQTSGSQDPQEPPAAPEGKPLHGKRSSKEKPLNFFRGASTAKTSEDVYAARRQLVLVAPLVILICLNMLMLVGQGLCEGHLEDHCRGLQCFNPTARVNRNLRFTLFVAMLQWMQAWTGLFPQWHVAFLQSKTWGTTLALWMLVLGLLPASLLRLCIWLFRPAGTGVSQHLIFGLRHFFVDALFVTGWSIWLCLASALVIRRNIIKKTGFSIRRIADDIAWQKLTASFKFTLVVWLTISWIRGCAKLGFAHGQSDWVFITILYPWLLAFIWTITFSTVAITRYGLGVPAVLLGIASGIAVSGMAAHSLLRLAGRLDKPLLTAIVVIYLGRQVLRLTARVLREIQPQESTPAAKSSGTPRAQFCSLTFSVSTDKMLQSSASERRMARVAIQVLVLICFTFVMVLMACVLLGGLQKRAGFILEDLMYWHRVPNGVEIVNAEVSRITLAKRPTNASHEPDPSTAEMKLGTQPRYAVCGHTWHDLTLLDYSFLSTLSYMGPTARNDLPSLLRLLMPHREVTIRQTPSWSRKWLDLEVKTCSQAPSRECSNITVIAISGTDPLRFSDYAENIRMWTEPVALQIMSAFFPSVRTWPRDTTSEVIALTQTVLEGVGMQDDRWEYQEILDHVRQKPAGETVVLTGHSLGGGMALVVGALTGRLAVALQPPGVSHSLAKHQSQHHARGREVGDTAVHQRSVSLKFEGDWVQHFDDHGGLVQTMSCDRSHQGVQLACHMLEGAICHLVHHCGDREQRFDSCRHEYDVHPAARVVVRSVWTSLKHHWRSASWRALDAYANLGPALRTALCVSVVAGLRQVPRLRLPSRLIQSWLGAHTG